jgi:hypothetical protein
MIIDVFQTLQTGSVAQVESDCFHDETVGGVSCKAVGTRLQFRVVPEQHSNDERADGRFVSKALFC